MSEVRVLVVDDHRSFADLLAAALVSAGGIRCVGTAGTAREAFRSVAELAPSVVTMNISMPGADGLDATRHLRSVSPGTAVVIVTGHTGNDWITRAAAAGASAFAPKGGSLAELVALVRSARPGPMAVAPSLPRTSAPPAPSGYLPLTVREVEVLGHIARGLPAKTVAKLMGISPHTCRSYIRAVYEKLHVSSRIEAVNRARQLHLLDVTTGAGLSLLTDAGPGARRPGSSEAKSSCGH